MNDEDFLTQFREAPSRDFADNLYRRINKPMVKQPPIQSPALRRTALAAAFAALALILALAISPTARAFAGEQLRQIGAILLRDRTAEVEARIPEAPGSIQPTAVPPAEDTATRQIAESAAAAASQAGFNILAPAAAPDGYEIQGAWVVVMQEDGTHVITSYREVEGDSFLTFSQSQFAADYTVEQSYGPNETVAEITVRGQEGVVISGRLMSHPYLDLPPTAVNLLPTNWLFWEADGITYTLYSDQLSPEALLAFAESLD